LQRSSAPQRATDPHRNYRTQTSSHRNGYRALPGRRRLQRRILPGSIPTFQRWSRGAKICGSQKDRLRKRQTKEKGPEYKITRAICVRNRELPDGSGREWSCIHLDAPQARRCGRHGARSLPEGFGSCRPSRVAALGRSVARRRATLRCSFLVETCARVDAYCASP
jgi:hypothetical protein